MAYLPAQCCPLISTVYIQPLFHLQFKYSPFAVCKHLSSFILLAASTVPSTSGAPHHAVQGDNVAPGHALCPCVTRPPPRPPATSSYWPLPRSPVTWPICKLCDGRPCLQICQCPCQQRCPCLQHPLRHRLACCCPVRQSLPELACNVSLCCMSWG